MKEYDNLKDIVEQLLFVGYKDDIGHRLENNTAFIALQRMAEEEKQNSFDEFEIWFNEDGESVTAPAAQFEGADDFVKKTIAYHKHLTGETIEVDNVDVDTFLITDGGVRGECSIKMKFADVTIINCYHADIMIIEESEGE